MCLLLGSLVVKIAGQNAAYVCDGFDMIEWLDNFYLELFGARSPEIHEQIATSSGRGKRRVIRTAQGQLRYAKPSDSFTSAKGFRNCWATKHYPTVLDEQINL
jgi:hypothetical protein